MKMTKLKYVASGNPPKELSGDYADVTAMLNAMREYGRLHIADDQEWTLYATLEDGGVIGCEKWGNA